MLRPGGRLLLRMCLNSAGLPNGLDEETIRGAFPAWPVVRMERRSLVSDTRTLPAVLALLTRPGSPGDGG